MGQTRSIIVGLALVLGQTAGAAAADLGLSPPPPVEVAPCVGCAGPWYIRGFVGGANPHVDDISSELFKFNDFQVFHNDIKSSLFVDGGLGLANAYIDLGTYHCFTPLSAAVPASPRSRSVASRMSTSRITACSSVRAIPRRTSPGRCTGASPMT